jgi:2-phosphoglycerate kinase
MFGMNKEFYESRGVGEDLIKEADFRFSKPNTLLFITGVPLSGKSTISPLITSMIEGTTLQNMDIIRLVAGQIEDLKPESQRNPFVYLGSSDAFTRVGDGTYTPEHLITGFNEYSKAVCAVMENILPYLEAQGAKDVIFEGVQLTPTLVGPLLKDNSKLIIVISSEEKLKANANKLFANESWLLERYSPDKLILLQNEILKQAQEISSDKLLIVENCGRYVDTIAVVMQFLVNSGTLVHK